MISSWRPILLAFVALQCTFLVQVCQSFHVGPLSDSRPFRHSVRCWSSQPRRAPLETRILDHEGKGVTATSSTSTSTSVNRRRIVGSLVASAWLAVTVTPTAAMARFVLDDETGDYVEVDDVDWQTAWKERLDKASSMSKDEIFQAARGAGNTESGSGPESDARKKRRAMSACRDVAVRGRAGAGTEQECTTRVLAGEVGFILESL